MSNLKYQIENYHFSKEETSIFSGYPSVCMMISSMNKSSVMSNTEIQLDRVAIQHFQSFEDCKMMDLVYGNTGFILYCIYQYRHYHDIKHLNYALHEIKRLENYVNNIIDNFEAEMGYLVSSIGNGNLGAAHGLIGALSVLFIAFLNGLRTSSLLDTIFKIRKVILNSKKAMYVLFGGDRIENANMSWCHGATGFIHSIVLAQNCVPMDKNEYQALLLKYVDLVEIFIENDIKNNLSLCHGVSGLLLEIIYLKKYVHRDVTNIINHCIDFLISNFDDIEYYYPGDYNSILFGRLGIIFVLLILENDWDPSEFLICNLGLTPRTENFIKTPPG